MTGTILDAKICSKCKERGYITKMPRDKVEYHSFVCNKCGHYFTQKEIHKLNWEVEYCEDCNEPICNCVCNDVKYGTEDFSEW